KLRLLVTGGAGGEALEGVPVNGVAVGALVDREVRLEHRALRPEISDAGLDVGLEGGGDLLGGWRQVVLLEAEAVDLHTEAAELHVDVGALGDVADVGFPRLE